MATRIGTERSEVLIGTDGDDLIVGGAGSDTIRALGGNDTIDSVDRPDNIFAGVVAPEADTVDGGAGNDVITGGRLDRLIGGAGDDVLLLNFNFDGPNLDPAAVSLRLNANGTGTANDGTFITGFERIVLSLTNRDDTVSTGDVSASLDGANGNDLLTTGSAADQVFGGGGNDTISSGGGDDVLSGGAGNDQISGGAGNDMLSVDPANEGSDQVDLGTGSDTVSFVGFETGQIRLTFTSADVGNGNALDGGNAANEDGGLAVRVQREDAAGNLIGDVSRYDDEGITFLEGTQGYTFDVRDLVSGTARGDQFIGVVLGTSGDDDLSFFPPFREAQSFYYNGGMGDDRVTAGSASDFLVGGAGNDTLDGGAGIDSFIGGGGNDTFVVDDASESITEAENGGTDTVIASTDFRLADNIENLVLANGSQARSGTGNNQANAITGNDADNVLSGAGGNDTLNGGGGNDELRGGTGNDTLNGGQGDDVLNGGSDDDRLAGGAGNDRLVGGLGDDRLFGGAGNDTLGGGAGRDIFAFTAADGPDSSDTVIDFVDGTDRILLRDLAVADIADAANGAVITFSNGSSVLLRDVDASSLTADDFILQGTVGFDGFLV